MFGKFWKDRRGNFAMMLGIAAVPIMGALALAIDYSEMLREKQDTLNALDAAGIATGYKLSEGATDTAAVAYAQQIFNANLHAVKPANVTLSVTLPNNNTGGGTLKMCANLVYNPYFLPVASQLLGKNSRQLTFSACSEVRLKDTIEVALVLDNSGSMAELGHGSSKVRFDLLKDAAKQLVDQLAGQAQQMKQIEKPVQFSLVPFAGSVNIGPDKASETWMDQNGISPVQNENFDWSTMNKSNSPWGSTKYVEQVSGVWYARGSGWGASQQDKPVTRFSIYNLMQRHTGNHQVLTGSHQECTTNRKGKTTCTTVNDYTTVADTAQMASWTGCVEARPYPYNLDDTPASNGTPATLFVPMFAPDETDNTDSSRRPANNNWTSDVTGSSNNVSRLLYMPKYFQDPTASSAITSAYASDEGPNMSCTTTPITPLTDVSNSAGSTTVKNAIDAMHDEGATNVPEGMAWGWRTLSSGAPFTGGRAETDRGNDKVLIVLTDGANTYYTPDSVIAQDYSGSYYNYGANDLSGLKSIYSALGYVLPPKLDSSYSYGRIFQGADSSVSKTNYSNSNYTSAMSSQLTTLCNNAKSNNLIVMTIALDLDMSNSAEAAQANTLKACSSDSRFRKDPTDPSKPAKLFWNSTGASLSGDFKQIGDELSNLRIVG